MNPRRSGTLAVLLLTFTFTSCKKAPAPDGVCSYEPLPVGAEVPSGQGGVLTAAATDAYFYAFDGTGKQIGAQVSNRLLALKPGDYQLKVNNSTHPISLPAKMLAKCTTGTVQAAGKTDEYYYIFDGAGTQLAAAKLGSALALFPCQLHTRLNNTPAALDITANGVVELKPGTLNVLGSTDEYYYVFNPTGTVNNSSVPVTIAAAGQTDISSGALLVQGTTDEYYYVFNAMGTQLASSKLGKAVALLEGPYTAKVNKARFPAKVHPARTHQYQTG